MHALIQGNEKSVWLDTLSDGDVRIRYKYTDIHADE